MLSALVSTSRNFTLACMVKPFPLPASRFPRLPVLLPRRAGQASRALGLASSYSVPRSSNVARRDATSHQTGPVDHLWHWAGSSKRVPIAARSVPLPEVSAARLRASRQPVEAQPVCRLRFHTIDRRLRAEDDEEKESEGDEEESEDDDVAKKQSRGKRNEDNESKKVRIC